MCTKYERAGSWLWAGIRRTNGTWKHSDGGSLVGIDFDWSERAPQVGEGLDYLVILCAQDTNYLKFKPGRLLFNVAKNFSANFICQN